MKQSKIIKRLIILTLIISVMVPDSTMSADAATISQPEVGKIQLKDGQSLKDWLKEHKAPKLTPQTPTPTTKEKISSKTKELKRKAQVEAPKLKKKAKSLLKKAAKLAKQGGKKAKKQAKKLTKKAKKLLKKARKYVSDYRKQSEKEVMDWVKNQGKK